VAGIAQVASSPYPDESQFDSKGKYFDPKATREQPRWISIDVRAVEKGRYLTLAEMRATPELQEMVLLQKGSRLSIMPVTPGEWNAVLRLVREGS
jgi:predicted RNA-binding protein with PUA-like domain